MAHLWLRPGCASRSRSSIWTNFDAIPKTFSSLIHYYMDDSGGKYQIYKEYLCKSKCMYCSILWNALHYNYVAGVALQQAACWLSGLVVLKLLKLWGSSIIKCSNWDKNFAKYVVRFILFRSEKCTFCNTACSMFCFWHN